MDCALNKKTLATILLVAQLIFGCLQHQVVCQHDVEDAGLVQVLNDTRFETFLNPDSYSMDEFHEHPRCQPLNIPFCENVEYNSTMLPNFLGHQTQQEVITEINIYHPLMRVSCSPDLKLFLCTVYAPICFDHVNGTKPLYLYPCRSLCESARSGCSTHMKQFNTEWPALLQCDKFPDKRQANDKGVICVGKPDDETKFSHTNIESSDSTRLDGYGANSVITRDLGFVCPKNFEVKSYTLHLNGKIYNNCAMPCDDVLLDKNSAQIVRLTTGILAITCLLSTLFTCITFIVDTKKFKYPARPIIIIAFCQLIVAICYLIGFLTSNKVSCNDPIEPPKALPNMKMIRAITVGNKKGSCTLQFMALYFFQMSTMLWWLMMTVSWFMIAKLEWAPEAVASVARYFHLFSWTIPGLLTIYLSVLGNIEGDPLTGTCYVSTSNQESIRAFVMYPSLICLILGCIFLSIGFKSIWHSWDALRREYGKQTDEHTKLVLRIGLFSLLFVTFSSILLYCHHYEQSNLNSWMISWLSNICKNREYSIPCPKNLSNYAPHYSTFVLKYLATMAVGVISALFMLSEKTLPSYREVAELCNYRI